MSVAFNRAAFDRANTAAKGLFLKAFDGTTIISDPFFFDTTTDRGNVDLHFSGGMPAMREWRGDREVRELARFVQNHRISKFELTVSVPVDDIDDDAFSQYAADFMQVGEAARHNRDVLFTELLEDGFEEEGYDGEPFFDAAHPIQGDTLSNLGTDALDAAAFEAGILALRRMKTWHGQPWDPIPRGRLKLVVPPELESAALDIVGIDRLSSGATNKNFKRADVVVNPRFTSAIQWYLLVGEGMSAKPLAYVGRKKPELVSKATPTDDNVFWDGDVIWGVSERCRAAYGEWRMAYGSTGVS